MIRSGHLLAVAAVAVLVPEFAVAADGGPSPSTYLIEVLDLVEQQAYYADRVDWMQWRVDAADEAATAQRTADTYDFVQRLLLELGDHHSGFFPPPSKNDESVPTMPFTRPSGGVGADAIGRLTLPGFSSDTALAAEYVGAAEDVVAADACGWIVDLRGNPGGNLFPMLAALAPLLGPGPLLGYQHRDGTTESFVLDDSGAVIAPDGSVLAGPTGRNPVRFTVGLPIAVVHGAGTASSGEGVVMALRGRPGVRSFGRPTAGVPTGNQLFELSDGSAINLTVAVGIDYGGEVNESSIAPDVVADTSGGTDEARFWLTHETSCRGVHSREQMPTHDPMQMRTNWTPTQGRRSVGPSETQATCVMTSAAKRSICSV